MEITNAVRKTVKSLDDLKGRRRENLFKVEGTKAVCDTIDGFALFSLFATRQWIDSHPAIAAKAADKLSPASRSDILKMSSLSTPSDVLAVYRLPSPETSDFDPDNLIIALDGIQDPGNLGTIIRLADWFGIQTIIASRETADCFAPKVVQATMGAITRVKVRYVDLPPTLNLLRSKGLEVYGTFLGGENLYDAELTVNGVLVIGNEGHGISPEVSQTVSRRLTIPPYPLDAHTSESLNAAVATSIVVSRFRSRLLTSLNR